MLSRQIRLPNAIVECVSQRVKDIINTCINHCLNSLGMEQRIGQGCIRRANFAEKLSRIRILCMLSL
jgi:hypothetical protein